MFLKRTLPLTLTAGIGLYMILSFFMPHQVLTVPAHFLQSCAIIVVAFGYVLGGANVLRINIEGISKRIPGWPYKVVLVVSLLAYVTIGAIEGRGFLNPGMRSKWMYDHLYTPMAATMFSLLAFFIASAAFRAFRIRTVEAGLLAAAALLVMLGRVPIGDVTTEWLTGGLRGVLPEHLWTAIQIGSIQDWIMNVPQNAAKRAILIGAALGVMATGLRVILGIERAYLSGED